jgi:hypothetical protein
MRALLDTCIWSYAEFLQPAIQDQVIRWGDIDVIQPISGLKKVPLANPSFQKQKDALFTIGRLIREGKISAYEYSEIWIERVRGRIKEQEGNALRDCQVSKCLPALERSKFASGSFFDLVAKGGKKDRKRGKQANNLSQISFFDWLTSLTEEGIKNLLKDADIIGLTQFEIESCRDIKLFQSICAEAGSKENYPDAFHLWTAERNRLDFLLTVDGPLIDMSSRIRSKEKSFHVEAILPLELMKRLGIKKMDTIPLKNDYFYSFLELETGIPSLSPKSNFLRKLGRRFKKFFS